MMDSELCVKFGVEAYQTGSKSDEQPNFRFGVQTIQTSDNDDSDVSSEFEAPTTLPHDYSDEDKIDLKELVDPGPFCYNRRVSAAALPIILLLLVLGGELLMIAATIGAVLLILLSREGESRTCVIIFILMFIPCQIYMLITVFPLVWLSGWNIFLILAINGGLLLTAGWMIMQFVAFRMEEPVFCQLIEQLLFTANPCISVMLTAWMFSTILPLSTIPVLVLLLGFALLQIYLIPVVSSFKLEDGDKDEDMNVIQQPIIVLMVAMLLVSPSVLHILFALFSPSTYSLLTIKSLLELLFIVCLSLFMVTLLSIRQLVEYLGMSFSLVIKARYVGGALTSILCYPVLQAFGLTSHFLPWLPVAMVGFSVLGIILSMKKYKFVAVVIMIFLTVLMSFWIYTLPWQLQYYFIDVISIQTFYILLFINFILCLLCIYVSTYSSVEILGLLVVIESLVLVVCEICLQKSDLTRLPIIHSTGIATVYMLHRLYIANKLSQIPAIVGASIHLTKVTSAVLDQVNSSQITLLSSILLFCLVFMSLKMFVFENRLDITENQTVSGLCLLLLALCGNVKTVISTLGVLLWLEQPSLSVLIGLWFLIGGLLVLLFTQFHTQPQTNITKLGLVMLLVSMVVLVVQPDIEFSLYSVFQWCELATILGLAGIIGSYLILTIKHIILLSTVLSLCPSIRLTLLLNENVLDIPMVLVLMISMTVIISLLLIYIKIDSFVQPIDIFIRNLCIVMLSSQVLMLIINMISINRSLLQLPVFKSLLFISIYCSVMLKLFSKKTVPGVLPVSSKRGEESISMLPIIGNITSFLAFILLCLYGPIDGFLHDMWCCGASVIFMCLQRDVFLFEQLRAYNQTTPTSVAAITVLVFATIYRNLTYNSEGIFRVILKVLELIILPCTLPVYVILWVIMWRHEILSEKLVILCLPLNAVLFLVSTSYTAVVLSITGICVGLYMIGYKLPMVPYGDQEFYYTR